MTFQYCTYNGVKSLSQFKILDLYNKYGRAGYLNSEGMNLLYSGMTVVFTFSVTNYLRECVKNFLFIN